MSFQIKSIWRKPSGEAYGVRRPILADENPMADWPANDRDFLCLDQASAAEIKTQFAGHLADLGRGQWRNLARDQWRTVGDVY